MDGVLDDKNAPFGLDVRTLSEGRPLAQQLDINIRCIRLQPYRADGKTLIDVQQVIPLPEAQEYTIRIREKQQQERRSRSARFSEESQQACVDYWQGVLDELTPASWSRA